MEKHLRSLESLKQDVNQDVFVSMIRAKLPEEVLLQLEMQHGANKKWTVDSLRYRLHEYITAREHSEKKGNSTESLFKRNNQTQPDNRPRSGPAMSNNSRQFYNQTDRKTPFSPPSQGKQASSSKSFIGSAEALVANTNQPSATRYYDQCRFCEQRHWSHECPKYRTVAERKKQLKGSCFKCLKTGHKAKDCKKGKTCVHCGEVNDHHRSLCQKKFSSNTSSTHLTEEVVELPTENAAYASENALVSSGEMVLMQTAKTEIKSQYNSRCEKVRILLDSGSQRTYVSESLAEKLQLKRESEESINLVTFGSNKPKSIKTSQTRLSIKLNNGQYLDITANIVPVISGSVQRKALKFCDSQNIDHLVRSLDMADTIPSETESADVELLVGNDYYLDIILTQKIEVQPGLYLLASKLGWILTGRTTEGVSNQEETSMLTLTYGTNITSTSVFQSVDNVIPTKPDLEDFWNIESIGILDNLITTNDELAKKRFKETLTFKDGRYQVTWPWKEEIPDLPLNRELAIGRLKSNVARMRHKPELMKQYNTIIQDQLNKGVIEKADYTLVNGPRHYLPHHAVINPHKPTTTLRVVYDASAKTRKEYNRLNDCLYRGPVMLNDLCGLLMRFRLHQIAIVADIEKAFLQVGLKPSQRDVTRFVWLKE
ncbi:MAG: hypothetical protein N0C90_24385, partial [Candidatus Thiodiazotropha endolucinida]|nr:hypothetical protein [Candidatus Thiodiazotropha taylori]MCW4264489.1 hypothetical protein [Candidatus Thiodiazotropha endolucinida]